MAESEFFSEEVIAAVEELGREIERIAGFRRDPHSDIRRALSVVASCDSHLRRAGQPDSDWLSNFFTSLADLQQALWCIAYHRERVEFIEQGLTARIAEHPRAAELQRRNGTLGGGNTLALDFEYQAFVLACRRALEYLGCALFYYFKQNRGYSPFKDARARMAKPHPLKPAPVHVALRAAFEEVSSLCEPFLTEQGDGTRSVRDTLTHYSYVPAGVLNITPRGVNLVGGGEDLPGWPQAPGAQQLAEALKRADSAISDVVSRILSSLAAAHASFFGGA
jgi:hypothetical protein